MVPIAEETQAAPAAGPPPPPPPRPSPAAPPPRCPARPARHLFAAAVAAATTHTKVIHCFMETGQFDKIMVYCQTVCCTPLTGASCLRVREPTHPRLRHAVLESVLALLPFPFRCLSRHAAPFAPCPTTPAGDHLQVIVQAAREYSKRSCDRIV